MLRPTVWVKQCNPSSQCEEEPQSGAGLTEASALRSEWVCEDRTPHLTWEAARIGFIHSSKLSTYCVSRHWVHNSKQADSCPHRTSSWRGKGDKGREIQHICRTNLARWSPSLKPVLAAQLRAGGSPVESQLTHKNGLLHFC